MGAFLVERRTRLLAAWAVPLLRAGLDEAAAAAEVTGTGSRAEVVAAAWPGALLAVGEAGLLWRGTERSTPMSKPARKKGEGRPLAPFAQSGVGMRFFLPRWQLFLPGFLLRSAMVGFLSMQCRRWCLSVHKFVASWSLGLKRRNSSTDLRGMIGWSGKRCLSFFFFVDTAGCSIPPLLLPINTRATGQARKQRTM